MSCRPNYDPCLDGKLNQIGSYAAAARSSATNAAASAESSEDFSQASATSATNAATSATQANNYLTQVENIFEDFDERYLGAKAAAPIVDNQGNPLQEGAMYWNSVANSLYVWDGSVWVALPTGFNEFTNFLATGTPTARNLVTREADVVNVKDFGAVGDGIADDTAAIQAALNYIHNGGPLNKTRNVYIPPGQYCHTGLLLPFTIGFCLFGEGTASVLVQKGGPIKYRTVNPFCFDSHSTIRDLTFDGTDGTGNTLELQYVQTIDVENVYFWNIPENHSALFLNGNPDDGTYSHDFRVMGIRIYNRIDYTKNSFAGIKLGSRVSDTLISDFIMQGFFRPQYCLFAESGALTTQIFDSHPFNVSKNVIRLDGVNNDFSFTNCAFDNSGEDLIYIKNTSNARFVNSHFQVKNGWGVTLDNSYNATLSVSKFNPLSAPYPEGCVREINIIGNGGNKVVYAQIENPSLFTNNLLLLNSPNSYATGIQYTGASPANRPFQTPNGSVYALTGVTQSGQLQNTTQYLGQNGRQASADDTNWSVPTQGYIKEFTVTASVTPAAGENYTFNLYKGPTLLATGVITSGQFSTSVILTDSNLASVAKGEPVYIESIFSTASGSSGLRYSVLLTG